MTIAANESRCDIRRELGTLEVNRSKSIAARIISDDLSDEDEKIKVSLELGGVLN
jgi:hypothetical protein